MYHQLINYLKEDEIKMQELKILRNRKKAFRHLIKLHHFVTN